jgi:hypothetical protein
MYITFPNLLPGSTSEFPAFINNSRKPTSAVITTMIIITITEFRVMRFPGK